MPARALLLAFSLALAACPADPTTAAPSLDVAAETDVSAFTDTSAEPDADAAAADVPPETSEVGPSANTSIRFFGNGGTYDDRVLIRLDDPTLPADPSPAVDLGATDFTIEFWMKARAEDNPNVITSCGPGIGWVESNIIIDRDRHSQAPTFGIGLSSSALLFAVCDAAYDCHTLCGSTSVLDNQWHHVAVQRSLSGTMTILVDGITDVTLDSGLSGDISYPDDGVPQNVCPGGLCDYSDPFLALGAEKHGYGGISYNGHLDELRLSTALRYGATYPVPTPPLAVDGDTVGMFRFGDGPGDQVTNAAGGVHGAFMFGGDPAGPIYVDDSP